MHSNYVGQYSTVRFYAVSADKYVYLYTASVKFCVCHLQVLTSARLRRLNKLLRNHSLNIFYAKLQMKTPCSARKQGAATPIRRIANVHIREAQMRMLVPGLGTWAGMEKT